LRPPAQEQVIGIYPRLTNQNQRFGLLGTCIVDVIRIERKREGYVRGGVDVVLVPLDLHHHPDCIPSIYFSSR
jgi:hypothetical protein